MNPIKNFLTNYITPTGRTVVIPQNPPLVRKEEEVEEDKYCVVCKGSGYATDSLGDPDKCWHCDGVGAEPVSDR